MKFLCFDVVVVVVSKVARTVHTVWLHNSITNRHYFQISFVISKIHKKLLKIEKKNTKELNFNSKCSCDASARCSHVESFIATLRERYGLLSFADIVLNHTADNTGS